MSEQKWWEPELCDAAYLARLRADYPEHADWSDEELHEHFNDGLKYVRTWDHIGDAYEEYEPLADAYLALRATNARLVEALEAVANEVREECMATYLGGHSDRHSLQVFRHGMDTVCNVVEEIANDALRRARGEQHE